MARPRLGKNPRLRNQRRDGLPRLENRKRFLAVLDVSAMSKNSKPKTLMEVFTVDYPKLFEDDFCECHRLQICPTAWMGAGQPKAKPVES